MLNVFLLRQKMKENEKVNYLSEKVTLSLYEITGQMKV